MPTLEVPSYEHFSFDETPMSLDEAIKKASELRKSDSENFYRVRPANDKGTTFIVAKVPASSIYADLAARVAKAVARYRLRGRQR